MIEHGGAIQSGRGAFGGQHGLAHLPQPGSVDVAEVLQQFEAVHGGFAVFVLFSQSAGEGFQVGQGVGGSQALRIRHGLVVVQDGGGANVGQGEEVTVGVAFDLLEAVEQVIDVKTGLLGVGSHIGQQLILEQADDVGVAKHSHGGNFVRLAGQLTLGVQLGIAADVGGFYKDVLFLADGLVEFVNGLFAGFQVGARGTVVPETNQGGFFRAGEAAQGQRHDQRESKRYELLHFGFLLLFICSRLPSACGAVD